MTNISNWSKGKSLALVFIAYIICLVAGYFSLRFGEAYMPPLWNMLVADVIATLVIWLFSLAVSNASMYDAYWSVIPMAIAYYWIKESGNKWDSKDIIVFAAVCYWGIRLTLNWVRGWSGLSHQDWRYKMLEDKNPKIYWITNLMGIHMFPTIIVYLCMIPVYFIVTSPDINIFLFTGFVISVIATTIELIADEQMRKFRRIAQKSDYIDVGLWRYSRHPNYFGEIGFWLGLAVMGLGASGGPWWTNLGVGALTCMFLFASIPMMEERTLKSRPKYADQMKKVNVLVPWFRKA